MTSDRFFLYDFCLLRMPTFPTEALLNLNRALEKIAHGCPDDATWEQVRSAFSHPLFVEAIFLASKDLYTALTDWLEAGNIPSPKNHKLLKALHRYYSRMSTRCTPYGLFAGCSYGGISPHPSGITFSEKKCRKHVHLSMGFIGEMANKMVKEPLIRDQLTYHVNNSLYRSGEKYFYIETIVNSGRFNHILSAVTASRYIEAAIKRAAPGATIADLAAHISALSDEVTGEAVRNFIHELIRAQVLISDLVPPVTGDDLTASFLDRLGRLQHTASIHEPLSRTVQLLSAEDTGLSAFVEVEAIASRLVSKEKLEYLHQDVYYSTEISNINKSVAEDIAKTSERLWNTVPPRSTSALDEFRQRFTSRYEGQEVPLVKAVDPDTGIGYGLAASGTSEIMPLLSGLMITIPKEENARAGNVFRNILSEKFKTFLKENTSCITLTEEDVDKLIAQNRTAALHRQESSAYIFGSILASSEKELDSGNYEFAPVQLLAPAVCKLLGRFALGDKRLWDKLKQCVLDEESANPGIIMAEVVHLPEGKLGNVVMRPRLRSYEIPFLSNSMAEQSFQLDINDLMVSVKNERVVLRSKRLDKEILPHINNAHSPELGQPLYRFLTDLKLQYINPGFVWSWSGYLDEPYLPRVKYRNFILSRARWRLKQEKNQSLSDQQAIEAYFHKLRETLQIPRYVVLSSSDNELFIDLENAFCREHVVQSLKKKDVILLEFLHMPENCFIRDENGSYNNEVIIPIGTKRPAFPTHSDHTVPPSTSSMDTTRVFPPGSDWLYCKIYGGNKILEKLLVDIIKPLAQKAIEDKAIDKWFFIRYNDPEGHLRVRFHRAQNLSAWMELLPDINRDLCPLIDDHRVAKLTTDTYFREMERYGAATITEAESIFFADSVAIAGFLDGIYGDEGEQLRWQMALYNIDVLLDDFGFDLANKSALLTVLKENFFR